MIKSNQRQHTNNTAVQLAEVLASAVLAAVTACGDDDFLPAVTGFFVSAFLSTEDASRFLMKSATSSSRSGSGLRQ